MNLKDLLTTVLEVIGLALIVAATYLAFGIAAALFIAGVLLLGVSFLLSRGGRK